MNPTAKAEAIVIDGLEVMIVESQRDDRRGQWMVRGCTPGGTWWINHAGKWDDRDSLDEGNYWPTREAAQQFALARSQAETFKHGMHPKEMSAIEARAEEILKLKAEAEAMPAPPPQDPLATARACLCAIRWVSTDIATARRMADQGIEEATEALGSQAGQGEGNPTPLELLQWARAIVDKTWNECTESELVPSTSWADKIIGSVPLPKLKWPFQVQGDGDVPRFYLQCENRGYIGNSPVFWGKCGNGYTQWLDEAALLTAAEVTSIIGSCRSHRFVEWPQSLIDGVAQRTVDIQKLQPLPSPPAQAESTPSNERH